MHAGRRPTIRTRIVLTTAALLALGCSASAGCSLVLGIHDISETTPGADSGTPCETSASCDDHNLCTVDTCVSGACDHAAEPDGSAPSAAQTAFDCKIVQCVAGAPVSSDDPQDLQPDAEDCTFDSCSNGQASHTPKADNTPCTMGTAGICLSGTCQIVCSNDAACDDKNPCTQDTCDKVLGLCAFAPLDGVSTPGAAQVGGDCNVQVCVNGVDTKTPDDTDLPLTATDCDHELCTNGVPGNPPLAIDVACGTPKVKFCDGAGKCVACNSAAQCGVDTDCLKRTCAAGACSAVNVPSGTHVSMQTPGDCHAVACDGLGGTLPQPIVDDTDTLSDNNDCTTDLCTNGSVSHVPLMPGDPCGNGQKCNASILCGCGNDAQCTAPATCGGGNPGIPFTCGCTKTSCAALGATCGAPSDGCGSTLSCNDGVKNGAETDVDCGGGGGCASTCGQGQHCVLDGDCGSGHCADGVCCNAVCSTVCVACTAVKKAGGLDGVCGSIAVGQLDTSAPTLCGGVNACDGAGTCKSGFGQPCAKLGDCASGVCVANVCQ